MGTTAQHFEDLLSRVPADLRERLTTGIKVMTLPGNVPPWTETELQVSAGQQFTLLAAGEITWSRHRNLSARPRHHLWARVGRAGSVLNGTQDTYTFESPDTGALHLCIYHGQWADRIGNLETPVSAYEKLGGEIDVAVIVWRGEAEAGLTELRDAVGGDPLIDAELARLAQPVERPNGWHYLWQTGYSDAFTEVEIGDRRFIRVRADNDQGILQRPASITLSPETRLSWSWRVTELPATEPEDTAPTHDYVSIAVEFDNGRDLTYMWSCALPTEKAFHCPIKHWTARETHLVVRSGTDGLGDWHTETRDVFDDYRRHMGPPPSAIVAVWLIVVSTFQHGTAEAEFADIELSDDFTRQTVL